MAQLRKRINEDLVASVCFEVDLRCCICEYRNGMPPRTSNGQIHHLDSNPSNNAPDNLVWLCLDHHEEAGRTGKAARRLSPRTIERFREELRRRVARARAEKEGEKRPQKEFFRAALDAAVTLDVSKLRARADHDWPEAERALVEIAWYPDSLGFEGRYAILELLEHLGGRTRHRMPDAVAHRISQSAINLLPLGPFRSTRRTRVAAHDVVLLEMGVQIGQTLAYDGALKLGRLRIAENGCDILWRILSFGVINRNRKIRDAAHDGFETALDGATRSNLPMAVAMVETARRHGEAGGVRLPEYPDDVVDAL